MKKKSTLIFALFFYITTSNAQTGNLLWARNMGGTKTDNCRSIAVDGSGNVYTTGNFYGTADFDPGAGTYNLTSAGGYDIFISKLDAGGNFLWAKSMGGNNSDYGLSIAVDGSGNVYTSGFFSDTADFDPGVGTSNLTSTGASDIFISKLDATGNFSWAKSMGGSNSDVGNSIAIDGAGNVYTTGVFSDTVDFDPGAGTYNLTSAGAYDIFISKLDASGNFVWTKSMGGSNSEYGFSIAIDAFGNIYTTGYFVGIGDFDPGAGTTNLTSAGGTDIFISKLDAAGNFGWAKSMGWIDQDYGHSIAVDGANFVNITGSFHGTVDFDPGAGTSNLTSAGVADIFVSKLDTAGNFGWAKSMGGTDQDHCFSIAVDGSSNVYTTGFFKGTADFDPGAGTSNLTSAGAFDIFISKLDAAGNFGWVKSMGGGDDDYGRSIAVDGSGNVHTTGYFAGIVDFDPGTRTSNLTSAGFTDIFISKLAGANVGILKNSFDNDFTVYPNPTKGEMSIDLGTSYDDVSVIVRNQLGHDILKKTYTGSSLLYLNIPGKTGMYFIEISSGDKKALLKVVKE